MGRAIQKGSLNKSTTIRIIDSTTFLPEQAVEHNTSGIDLWYRREGGARVAITEVALAALTTAHTDGGIEHIDDGYYRLDPPDAAWATSADNVAFGGTVTGMIVIGNVHPLVDYDPEDGVRLGLTGLPNAAADAAGGLPISDAGGLDIDTKLANTNEITVARMAALTDWINGGRLDLLLDAIPTTAMRGTDGALTDKAGFSLSTAGILAVWHQLTSAIATAGSIGKLIKDEITAVRMAALTDWINGGRLDLILDAIPTTAMRGTDSAALASVATEARLAELDAANLPTDIDSLITAVVTASGEPAQSAPPVSAAMQVKINWLYKNFRNKKEQDASEWRLFNDAGSVVDHKATVSDAAGTATKEEIASGP